MLQSDLYTWLTTNAPVVALFPGGVHHQSLPQESISWPSLTFFQVSRIEIAEDMEQPNDAKMDQASYQFDVMADTSQAAVSAAESFLSIFRNFRGTMSATRIQHVDLSSIAHLEERRGDKLRRRVSMDFSIIFEV